MIPSPPKQYQLIVDDTARLSDRRQTVNNLYLSANSLLLGGLAILVQQSGQKHSLSIFLIILLAMAGTFLCLDWWRLLGNYSKLLNLRFNILREIEKVNEFPIKTYHLEQEKLYPVDAKKNLFGFTAVERNLPWIFIVLYWLVVIGSIFFEYQLIVA